MKKHDWGAIEPSPHSLEFCRICKQCGIRIFGMTRIGLENPMFPPLSSHIQSNDCDIEMVRLIQDD